MKIEILVVSEISMNDCTHLKFANRVSKSVLKHGGGLTELRSWIGKWNNDGMVDRIETETGQVCNYTR